jgi:hypothetical protein
MPAQELDLESLELELLEQALYVVRGAMRFGEIEPDSDTPPQPWIDRFGAEEAERRLRYARAGHASNPAGLRVALTLVQSILKSQSAKVEDHNPLNVDTKVILSELQPGDYPVKSLE